MKSPFCLVIGESLIDIVPGDHTLEEYPGGSPMNVAAGLGRLGRPTRLATWFGHDARGRLIAEHLAQSHVALVPGSDDAARTSTATVTFDTAGTAHYAFDLEWQMPSLAGLPIPLVAHAGSLGTALLPGADDVLTAVASLGRSGATISFDPNVRPAIVGEAGDRFERFVRVADIVKVSDEDLDCLYPGTDPLEAAKAWLGLGPALVVLTRGANGAVGLTAKDTITVAAPHVQVIDTVGAGDSFMAGLLHSLWDADLIGPGRRDELATLSADRLQPILELATNVAAITLTRAGANPPWAAELLAL